MNRIWEIDVLRALAITLMVIFHMVYDLNYFADYEINYRSGFWYWEGQLAAMIFMFVSGISSGLTSKNVARTGLKVFGFGMAITVVTLVFFGDTYVRFGILHFLGTSMMLYPLLKRFDSWTLFTLAAVNALMGFYFKTIMLNTSLLLPVGIMYPGFRSVDYYPLAPYLSVFILGIIAYRVYYYQRKSLFSFQIQSKPILFLSRNSLKIYLLHQPVIIAIILALVETGIL
ncbi:heparan-alpha-glucosaminide N-acetyltransferase [Desulfuribacillus alkaliarsenatis]|uniref:Heparan-alpha-glucosaminide N-acetyltransferase catalytic domain-containing protein n=1 Tax=Desulfuribacillus alkaliarsenatis TaxID=766136 RepID=A0A1E5G103_9FIRM|nr:heparan-alpha-glucosaminide N-acetyltransferase [Desulfuribacillus alkaliarsenatis]OEF96592.1 hypothetical protein BHF68_08075 [Desulfuribacillus alkaliarsenatis]